MSAGTATEAVLATGRPPGPFVSVPARIAALAERAAHHTAVTATDAQLTYGELDDRADQLAAGLRASGVGPGSCVAVSLPRSARYVVAALAVMKAGAAYLPLDPATPTARVEYILGDAGAELLLTDHDHADAAPRGPWVVLDLDGPPGPAPDPGSAAGPFPGQDDLAYVIYTSGSTGRPKGVEITHANLAHLVDWHVAAFGVSGDDRASQVAGLGFDAAVWEIWPHLAAGASLHVADDRTHRSPQLLQDWLVAQEITIAFAPTLLAEQLMHADWPERTALRTLLTGAERLNRRPLGGLPFTVVNNYGPTECTVVATSGVVAPTSDHAGPPSIGGPLPGTVALVLDETLHPVGEDEPGELVLAGPHVGRGYRNDAERTAERFVTLPADTGTTARAYRTGDRVQRRQDGRFDFLGRLDDQVKVRGHRIEPAEIIAWLTRCPGVGAGTVVALGGGSGSADDDDGERELVAYLVPAGDQAPSATAVRASLAAQLPEYMVPAHVVTLAALPTTPNGKLDTAALPRPDAAEHTAPPGASESASDIEAWLQNLLAELLKLPQVGVDDNIFLLGGHSMLAMQVISRVRQRYEVKLALRQLFRGPTISAMAVEIARQQEVGA